MRVVCDTGPIVAAANHRDRAHSLAADLVTALGPDLAIPVPVLVEVDQLLRARVSGAAARAFLEAVSTGAHSVVHLTPRLLRRAVEVDARFADLELGIADAAVMAVAERDGLPILTFDFEDFRAAVPDRGYWTLVVDEERFRQATSVT